MGEPETHRHWSCTPEASCTSAGEWSGRGAPQKGTKKAPSPLHLKGQRPLGEGSTGEVPKRGPLGVWQESLSTTRPTTDKGHMEEGQLLRELTLRPSTDKDHRGRTRLSK